MATSSNWSRQCTRKKLKIESIKFVDNQECLDLIEKKPKGILPMLDEECVVPKGSDMSLLQKMTETRKCAFSKPRKRGRVDLRCEPYAGGVAYSVEGFLEKNRDLLQPDIQSFMAGSKNALVKELFPPPAPKAAYDALVSSRSRSPSFTKSSCRRTRFYQVCQAKPGKTAGCLRQPVRHLLILVSLRSTYPSARLPGQAQPPGVPRAVRYPRASEERGGSSKEGRDRRRMADG